MDEIKKGFDFGFKGVDFGFKGLQIVKTYNKEIICDKHGPYRATMTVYSDGYEATDDYCPLCKKIQDEETAAETKRLEVERNIQKCKDCNIEPEYYTKTLDDYVPVTDSQKKAKECAEKILSGELKKLVLLGGNGVGKTMLGSILARELNGKIYTMYEISTMIRQSYTTKAERSELEIVKELASIPFLAIDELGRTKGSDAELNWLSYVLDKRHTRNLPFMIMTNGHLKSDCPEHGCDRCFENYMDKDIVSRLRQNSKILNIKSKDFRAN